MKKILIKNFIRIAIIIFLIMAFYQNFCFADIIAPTDDQISGIGDYVFVLILIIGLIVLLVSIISFFILHILVKKDRTSKTIKKSKRAMMIRKMRKFIYILAIFFAIAGSFISLFLTHIEYDYMVGKWIFLFNIPIIILCIISIALRKNKRKVSNIICVITILLAILLICIIPLTFYNIDKKFEDYNQTFKDYTSITELINLVSENNINNENKITVVFNDTEYTTTKELNILKNMLNKYTRKLRCRI